MQAHARVVVIGGGVMGVSLLYHLSKLGWRDLVLLEKNELTAGSTWHAAGLCTHFAHSPTIQEMRAHSVRLYRAGLTEETGLPVGFHACGAMRVTRSRERLDEFRHVRGLGRFTGYNFEVIGPDEIRDLHPLAVTDGLVGAIYEPDDGHVDPSQATQAMAAAARTGGASIYRHMPVQAIEPTGNGEWRVHCAAGSIRAEHVVNAAGTWCREIGEMMGVDLPVVPMLHQYLVTDSIDAVAALERELPIIRDPEESWYVRQERDGLICGPYEKDARSWAVDGVPPEFGMELLPPDLDRVEHVLEAAMARVPALAEGGVKSVVNGPITFTPDGNPLIGPVFGLRNAWLLTGSSMGVMEGGGAGRFLAEWMDGGEPPMDALAVDPRRFGGYADRDYRVAKAKECFGLQFGIHYPYEERPAGRPRRRSAVHDTLLHAGAVMGSAYGWERPNYYARTSREREPCLTFGRSNWFDAVGEECRGVSESVGIADLSVFSKYEVTGPGAARWLEGLGANRPPRVDGRVGLVHVLAPSGGVASELTVTRIDETRFYLTSAAAAQRHDLDLLRARARGHDVRVRDVSDEIGVLGLMGPSAAALLASLCDTDLSQDAFPWLTACEIEVRGVALRALRVSYVGESGFELHVPMEKLEGVYAALAGEGARHGLTRFGAFAMNAMRLEKGYRAWGVDLTTERSPLEAGLAHIVRTEGREFVGRDGLLAREADDPWRMGLLALDSGEVDPFGMHPVLSAGEVMGVTTSGGYGHRTGTALALAYFRGPVPEPALELHVDLLGVQRPVRVLAACPYDSANTRMRA